MEDHLQILENTDTEYLTLSYVDQALDSNAEQLSNESINLGSVSYQNISTMTPLNDLLLGQTFIIETEDHPIFINGVQLITLQDIDSNEQLNNIQTISTTDSDKSTIQNIDFDIGSNHLQDTCTDFNQMSSGLLKTTAVSNNLKDHLEILNNTDIDTTRGNYSNSTAIKILDDVAKSPIDKNGHFICDLCLCEFYNWQNYKRHKLEHLNDKPFKCLKCFKSFNYNNNYLLHIATHLTNNLKCPQCKKEFKRIASFKSHLKIHKTEESITCNICCKIFNNQYHLDIHKENCLQENLINSDNHMEIISIACFKTCKTCKKSFSTQSEYKMHVKEHTKFDLVLKKQYKFTMKHKNGHKTRSTIKRFKCDHCDWSFNKSNLLHRHMRTHTGEKPFKCSYCSRYFTQQNSLKRHLLKHKGLRPFKCEFCEMNFAQKGHLINHMKRCHAVTKEATRIHKCSMCTCVYNSLNALNKHLNIYHGLKNEKSNIVDQNHGLKNVETDSINENLNFKDPSKLEKWLEEVAHELQSDDDDNIKLNAPISIQCEFGLNLIENEHYDHIDKDSSPVSNINIDINIYNVAEKKQEKLSNQICDTVVQNQEKDQELVNTIVNESMSNLKKNTIKVPSKKKSHRDTMPKSDIKKILSKKTKSHTLNLKSSNISHLSMKSTHHMSVKAEPKVLYVPNITTELNDVDSCIVSYEQFTYKTQKPQPKICQYCGKIFKKNADLERHERIHTGDKPYKCDKQDCNKAFATKSSLEYHAITHVGKMKRALCPECNGLFATTSSMKVHMRQHTGEKPYKCPVCGDAFRTSGHLRTHVIIHERKKKPKQ